MPWRKDLKQSMKIWLQGLFKTKPAVPGSKSYPVRRKQQKEKTPKHPRGEFMCGMRDLLKGYEKIETDENVIEKIKTIRAIFNDSSANLYEELYMSNVAIDQASIYTASKLINSSKQGKII